MLSHVALGFFLEETTLNWLEGTLENSGAKKVVCFSCKKNPSARLIYDHGWMPFVWVLTHCFIAMFVFKGVGHSTKENKINALPYFCFKVIGLRGRAARFAPEGHFVVGFCHNNMGALKVHLLCWPCGQRLHSNSTRGSLKNIPALENSYIFEFPGERQPTTRPTSIPHTHFQSGPVASCDKTPEVLLVKFPPGGGDW